MNGQSVLVTGGCGFIGSNLVQELVREGFPTLTIVDRKIRRGMDRWFPPSLDLRLVELDIRSPELLRVLKERNVDTVIHLAALHYIPYCEKHPEEAWEVNVLGTDSVLAGCRRYDVQRFFMASTAAVYKSSQSPHREADPLEAMDVYGRTKVANEEQVRTAAKTSDCRFAIGRVSNAVGAYETNPHLIPEILKRIQSSNRIEIGNTESRRDYIHVRDISAAIIKMTFDLGAGVDVCNIGTGVAHSVTEIVQMLSKIAQQPIELVPSDRLRRRVDRPVLATDSSRLRNKYRWSPRHTLEDALREALDFARSPQGRELHWSLFS